jgi:NhaP-type Na+/H+ or K+/H+ antiporter
MILMGLLAGPLLNIVDVDELTRIVPSLFTLSLIIVLLEGGISTNIFDIARTMPIAALFTCIVFITTTVVCGSFLFLVVGWELLQSILLAVVCTGTATLPVIYLLSKMSIPSDVKHLLILESIINDITIITSVTLIVQTSTLTLDWRATFEQIVLYVGVAVVYGLPSVPVWAYILVKFFRDPTLIYISTLAIATIIYALAEIGNGSGVIALVLFSLFLGNFVQVLQRSHIFEPDTMDLISKLSERLASLNITQTEIAFLAKNFFFFILGALFQTSMLSWFLVLLCVILIILMIISRYLSAKIITLIDTRYRGYEQIISLMLPRGFTAILAAFIPLERDVDAPLLREAVLVIVIITTIAANISSFLRRNK